MFRSISQGAPILLTCKHRTQAFQIRPMYTLYMYVIMVSYTATHGFVSVIATSCHQYLCCHIDLVTLLFCIVSLPAGIITIIMVTVTMTTTISL